MKFENECWDHFKGETWKREINVRDFVQNNYKPYDGDESFLEGFLFSRFFREDP